MYTKHETGRIRVHFKNKLRTYNEIELYYSINKRKQTNLRKSCRTPM